MGRNEGGELRVSKETGSYPESDRGEVDRGASTLTAFVPSTGMSGAIWVTSCAMTCLHPKKTLKS